MAKATIAYCHQNLAHALDDEMCNAVDAYEQSTRRKIQLMLHQCREFYVTDSTQDTSPDHSAATVSNAARESIPDKYRTPRVEGTIESNTDCKSRFVVPGSISDVPGIAREKDPP
jgi:hypothetical protein